MVSLRRWRLAPVVGGLGREVIEMPASSPSDASSSLLEKPAIRAAVWSGVRSVVALSPFSTSSTALSVVLDSLTVTPFGASLSSFGTAVVFDFFSADFSGAGFSADFVVLAFLTTSIAPSALLRFLVVVCVDIVLRMDVVKFRDRSRTFFK